MIEEEASQVEGLQEAFALVEGDDALHAVEVLGFQVKVLGELHHADNGSALSPDGAGGLDEGFGGTGERELAGLAQQFADIELVVAVATFQLCSYVVTVEREDVGDEHCGIGPGLASGLREMLKGDRN